MTGPLRLLGVRLSMGAWLQTERREVYDVCQMSVKADKAMLIRQQIHTKPFQIEVGAFFVGVIRNLL